MTEIEKIIERKTEQIIKLKNTIRELNAALNLSYLNKHAVEKKLQDAKEALAEHNIDIEAIEIKCAFDKTRPCTPFCRAFIKGDSMNGGSCFRLYGVRG